MKTQDRKILEALTGRPVADGQNGTTTVDGVFTTMSAMAADALESVARRHVQNMIVHEGASALDAQASTNLDVRRAAEAAHKSGGTALEGVEAATAALSSANARYQGQAATGRPHTVVAAEAAARNWTPRLVRETRKGN